MMSAVAPIAALLLSVAILLTGNGLQRTLLPIRAQMEAFSMLDIGLMGSAYNPGFALGCLLAPLIVRRAGHIRSFTAMICIASSVGLAHTLFLKPTIWWLFRPLPAFVSQRFL